MHTAHANNVRTYKKHTGANECMLYLAYKYLPANAYYCQKHTNEYILYLTYKNIPTNAYYILHTKNLLVPTCAYFILNTKNIPTNAYVLYFNILHMPQSNGIDIKKKTYMPVRTYLRITIFTYFVSQIFRKKISLNFAPFIRFSFFLLLFFTSRKLCIFR